LRLADFVASKIGDDYDPYGLLLRRLNAGKVVIFDTETTGLDVTRDDVVELAALRLGGHADLATMQALLKRDRPLEESSRVHGITAEMLAQEGRDPRQVFDEFRSFVEGCVLAGHNVGYDVAIVRSQMRRLGLEWEPPPAFDTLELSRRLLSLP